MKSPLMFVINHLARGLINLGLRFVPLSLNIPVMGNYAVDMSPIETLVMDTLTTALYLRAEVLNSAKDIRGSYPTPVDLHQIAAVKPSSLELLLNVQPFASLFSVMQKSGDLQILLQDEQVFKVTGFLHLRTSDFRYYIPGLMRFGDKAMNLSISVYGDVPRVVLTAPNKFQAVGGMAVDFLLPGVGSAIKLGVNCDLTVTAAINDKKDLVAKLVNIGIKDIVVIGKPLIDPPPVEAMVKEFNTLFKFIVNGVNIFAFDTPIHIPDVIPLDFIKLLIPAASLRILNGALGAAATLQFLP